MKLNYPQLAFALFMSALGIPSITAQVSTPAYGIIDIGGGIPLTVASNGMVVISRGNSPTGSFNRYKAGVDELLGDDRWFQFADMNDAGDIVGVTPLNGQTAYAIFNTNSASTLTRWAQAGQQTFGNSSGSRLTIINENRTVTGFEHTDQGPGTSALGRGPNSFPPPPIP